MSSIRRRVNNRKDDWVAKITTRLVEDYDLIALEALNTRQMTRKPKPKQDPTIRDATCATVRRPKRD